MIMITGSSFKNVERLRYRINVDNEQSKKEEILVDKVCNSVFSSLFSAIISALLCVFPKSQDETFFQYFINEYPVWTIVFICLIYIGLFIFIRDIKSIAKKICFLFGLYAKKNEKEKIDEAKEMIKKYDNITCDSIFMAWEYMEVLKHDIGNEYKDEHLLKSYYFELLHYLKTAYDGTMELLDTDLAIYQADKKADDKVEKYRLNNNTEMLEVMYNYVVKLLTEKKYFTFSDQEKELINNDIMRINIKSLNEKIIKI